MTADLREPETAAMPESREARSDRAAAAIGALPFVKDRGDGTDRALAPADPLPGLWEEFQRLHRAYEAATHAPGGGDFDTPECKRIWADMEAVEARLTSTRPTSPEGIEAQLSYALHEGMAEGIDTTGAARGMFGLILEALGGGGVTLPAPRPADSPVMRAYREWKARYDWIESPATDGMSDDALNAAHAQRDDIEARLFALPCETPCDALAKLVAYALGGFDLSSGGDWPDRLLGEALAALGDDTARPIPPEATDPVPGMVEEWRAVAAEVNGGALSGLAAEVKEAQLLSLDATIQAMRPRSLAGAAALLRFAQEVHAIEDHTPEGCGIIGAVVALLEAETCPPAC